MIQHEFGIYGGRDGEYVLTFAGELAVPYAVTLHTVLTRPSAGPGACADRALCAGLPPCWCSRSRHATWWSRPASPTPIASTSCPTARRPRSATSLTATALGRCRWRASRPRVDATAPTASWCRRSGCCRRARGSRWRSRRSPSWFHSSRTSCSWWPARPIPRSPAATARVIGSPCSASPMSSAWPTTWSSTTASSTIGEVARLLAATDVFVTTYHEPEQSVSGALTFALAAGRPVVSTRYRYAVDLLSDGAGTLVAFGDAGEVQSRARRAARAPGPSACDAPCRPRRRSVAVVARRRAGHRRAARAGGRPHAGAVAPGASRAAAGAGAHRPPVRARRRRRHRAARRRRGTQPIDGILRRRRRPPGTGGPPPRRTDRRRRVVSGHRQRRRLPRPRPRHAPW